MNNVVITGMGIISSIGFSVEQFWQSLIQGHIAMVEPPEPSVPFTSPIPTDFDPSHWLDSNAIRTTNRLTQFAICAAMDAVAMGGAPTLPSRRTAVILGSTMGSVPSLVETQSALEREGARAVPGRLMSQVIPNIPAAHIAMRWRLHGPLLTISTACASSLDAIGLAAKMIERGEVDYAIAGGVDGLLTPVVAHSLMRARAASQAARPEMASRPFDRYRTGFVMGEGAGIVVLERRGSAERRGQPILARVVGYGSIADAFHVTSPDPSGKWEALAMQLALEDAGIIPAEIDAVIAHGTATPVGDSAEIQAINHIFAQPGSPRVTSIKGHIGHSMAAAGVMAIIAGTNALRHGQLPPTMGTTEVDPAAQFELITTEARSFPIRQLQANAFGFGGQNASLILSQGDDP